VVNRISDFTIVPLDSPGKDSFVAPKDEVTQIL